MAIITIADLAPWVGPSEDQLNEDPLAQKVVDHASLLVNDAARQDWTLDAPDPEKRPPPVAAMIAEQVAARTYSNPRVVQQRSAGPMSERLADVVLTGMSLRPDEVERLGEYRPSGSGQGGGVWIQPTLMEDARADWAVPYVDAYTGLTSQFTLPMGYPSGGYYV